MSLLYKIFNVPRNEDEIIDKARNKDRLVKIWSDYEEIDLDKEQSYLEHFNKVGLDEVDSSPNFKTYSNRIWLPTMEKIEKHPEIESTLFYNKVIEDKRKSFENMLELAEKCEYKGADYDLNVMLSDVFDSFEQPGYFNVDKDKVNYWISKFEHEIDKLHYFGPRLIHSSYEYIRQAADRNK